MGMYLNIGNEGFESIRKGLYVDKSGLISFINSTLGTKDKLTCVSRPRRFGKSFATQMLCAYYDKSCDSKKLFSDLKIAKDPEYEKYLNKYDVIYLDITWFISTVKNRKNVVEYLQQQLIRELCDTYCFVEQEESLPVMLARIAELTGSKFIIIIDEWDALFREAKEDTDLQKEYLQLLRGMFKSSITDKMIEAAYMTGILPIKKYGTQSALTDFREYTMLQPKKLAEYVGFTEDEVEKLCKEYHMDFGEAKKWYDGYSVGRVGSVYSPNSVIQAVTNEEFADYWTETETYESLKFYIGLNEDGLKDAIILMLGGERYRINTRTFQNDMANIKTKDDALTLLVHLGYLAYDSDKKEVYIPNQEVADEFRNAVEFSDWGEISKALASSETLLEATLKGDAETVASQIDKIHSANVSVLSYNNENALSCIITIAYYVAQKDYVLIREMPTGKGLADIVFLPRKQTCKPAMLIELKWDQTAQGAMSQIKEKKYPEAVQNYTGDILLVGINYNTKDKKHECVIERVQISG
ncbi:MAG: AAA family ATPase [Bariatricus sp.]